MYHAVQAYSTTTQSSSYARRYSLAISISPLRVLVVLGWSWNWTRVLSADLSNITKPSNPTLSAHFQWVFQLAIYDGQLKPGSPLSICKKGVLWR